MTPAERAKFQSLIGNSSREAKISTDPYIIQAQVQAVKDIAEGFVDVITKVIKLHGRDPHSSQLVAEAFAWTLRMLKDNGRPDIYENVRQLLDKFSGEEGGDG